MAELAAQPVSVRPVIIPTIRGATRTRFPHMKKTILFLILALPTLALLAADVTGTWKFDFESQIVHQNYTLTLKQEGPKLTGKANSEISEQKREAELKEGKVEGDTISFVEMLNFNENEIRITY